MINNSMYFLFTDIKNKTTRFKKKLIKQKRYLKKKLKKRFKS
jgi:hypothetical protein